MFCRRVFEPARAFARVPAQPGCHAMVHRPLRQAVQPGFGRGRHKPFDRGIDSRRCSPQRAHYGSVCTTLVRTCGQRDRCDRCVWGDSPLCVGRFPFVSLCGTTGHHLAAASGAFAAAHADDSPSGNDLYGCKLEVCHVRATKPHSSVPSVPPHAVHRCTRRHVCAARGWMRDGYAIRSPSECFTHIGRHVRDQRVRHRPRPGTGQPSFSW